MRTKLGQRLGLEYPIFAFTHCRDVVVAVSKAGGLGVLGAVGFTADELEAELRWIDEHIGGKPYGVDIVIPMKYEGIGELDANKLEEQLRAMIPEGHRAYAKKVLRENNVPELPEGEKVHELLGWTAATAGPLVETALRHEGVRLIANALGTPPVDVVRQIQGSGRLVGALCGSIKHARAHQAAGLDFVVCQGSEGGGHTGDVGSIVLWPEVIRALAPMPVLAAGGIGTGRQMAAAMAMGADGVWTGSIWLTVEESQTPPAAKQTFLNATSRDTVRSRSFTGKPCRMLRNAWTDAWEKSDAPRPLGMPLQYMVSAEAVLRSNRYADKAQPVAFNAVGQIVGAMNSVRPVREVIRDIVEEYVDSIERLNGLMGGD